MSKHHRSTMPSSASARIRASSIAAQNASAGMPRDTCEYGVTVSSAYRTCWRASSRPTS
jgi:hypothetical protein